MLSATRFSCRPVSNCPALAAARPQAAGCKAPQQPRHAECTLASSVISCAPSTSDRRLVVVAASPETEEQRSPLDAPQEWEVPMPSKRPDIFPEFDKMNQVFLPKPLPGDPEMPDEESEEAAKRTNPGDPDPEQKPGEPPEIPEKPAEPGQEPEKKTDIPNMPE